MPRFKRIFFLSVFFGLSFALYLAPVSVQALSLTKLEQQINITDGEFTTTSAADSPTNGALGLVNFDPSQYTGDSVYFEIVARCEACNGDGNNQVSASLYNSSGVSQSTLTTTSSTNDRVRSETALDLDAGTYTVRFHRDDDAGTAYLVAARLIVVQSAADLTDTQTQIEVGSYITNITTTSAATLSAPKLYRYDHSQFSGTLNAYFEATFRTSNNAALVSYEFDDYDTGGSPEQWDTDPANMVDGSTSTYASTSSDGDTQLLTANSYPGSRSEVITKVELRAFAYQDTDTTGSITLRPVFGGSSDGDNHNFNPQADSGAWSSYFDITSDTNAPSTWSWSDIQNLNLDVVWNANAGSNTGYVSQVDIRITYEDPNVLAYVELYNQTNSAVVGNSTLSSSSNSFSLVRSSALSTDWDTTNTDIYVVRAYTSDGGNPLEISNAKIIIDQTDATNIKKVETILHQVTGSRSHLSTTFATQNFLNLYNPTNYTSGNVTRAFFEVNLYTTSGGTAYSRLYNRSDSEDIDDPEDSLQTTDSTSLQILRSDNLFTNTDWPSASKNLDTTLNSTSGHTATLTNSWVIIQSAALEPQLSFAIEGVDADETNNGVTSTVATSITTIPFGNIFAGTPQFATHKLTITSNEAVGSYTMNVYLDSQLQGNYPANNIDPFAGGGATWSDPKAWISPDGTAANTNTGWIGANTSDTAVSGWASGSNRWGPLGETPIEVVTSPDGSSKTVYVSYGLEVNVLQPADGYAGQVVYYLLPTF